MRDGARGPAVRSELFGGRGAVKVWDLLGTDAAPPFSAVLACELEPNGSVGEHRQERDPEIVLGLEGEGIARVDGKEQRLEAGSVVYLPLGSTLSIENRASDRPLSYFIIKAVLPAASAG